MVSSSTALTAWLESLPHRLSRMGTAAAILVGLMVTQARAQSTANVTIQADLPGAGISSNLFGIFFEEINSAGDGGIYGELVRNRSFEDSTNAAFWNLSTSGTAAGQIALDTSLPLSATNTHALRITMSGGIGKVSAINSGYWGMSVTNGASYQLGFYARCSNGFTGSLIATLQSASGTVYAQASASGLSSSWQHFNLALSPNTTDPAAVLSLGTAQVGTVYVDFVSLFPTATFQGRTNGLRPDLSDMLVNLQPSFMRFPGGSWVNGSSLANAYHWELTIGDPANRTPRNNFWGYMVDNGLGYHEYLQMCEDIGAQPLLVINCGMDFYQNAVAPTQLGPWIQEALDAVQYANGDSSTFWGALRAANGHPTPFNLQYLEIGNENNGTAYDVNYALFYDALKSNYPNLHLIADSFGTVPSSRPTEILDEHYYASPGFFISNAAKYDSYSRAGPKVYVGEYAVTAGSGNGNLAGALAEAAFMTGLERNGDIITMASYAPLFANLNNKNWNPDLIYFNGNRVYGTPSYYVQQMFSQNRADYVLPTALTVNLNSPDAVPQGSIGVGSWNTSVQFTNIAVTSNGVALYQSDFVHNGTTGWRTHNGTWSVGSGTYQQTAIATDCRSTTGSTSWSDYTLTLQARKVTGNEGFLVLFHWLDDNNWTWWNIGGWNNTQDGIEQMIGGTKSLISSQVNSDIPIQTGVWYTIQVVLTGPRIQCYLNNQLIHDITNTTAAVVADAGYDQASGQIVVKAVNTSASSVLTTFNLTGLDAVAASAPLIQLASANATNENSLTSPTAVFPTTNTIGNGSTNFALTLPANSLSILRLQPVGIHTLTNLQLQVVSPINMGQSAQASVTAGISGRTGAVDLLGDPASAHAVRFSSADPSVATVDVNGLVTGAEPGNTTVVASYAGSSATQSVQVVGIPTAPTSLIHRYTFNDGTANDSVGSANGIFYNADGLSSIANGRLNLTGASGDYVNLGAGLLDSTNLSTGAVSLETWATVNPANGAWARLFDFGDMSNNQGGRYIFLTANNAANGGVARLAVSDVSPGNTDETGFYFANLLGQTNVHVVAVFNPNPARQALALYLNGSLVTAVPTENKTLASIHDVYSFLGRSLYSGDAWLAGSIDEFRIYDGELSFNEVAAAQILGPNQLLSLAPPVLGISLSDTNATLFWPLASAGFRLQTATNLANANWSSGSSPAPQIVDGQWEVVVPRDTSTQFYRLTQ